MKRTPLDDKIEEFEKLLDENPEDVSALQGYGEANLLRGRVLEAMKSYQKVVAIQPETVEAQLALGKIYLDSGLINEASGVVKRVLETAPNNIEGHILLRRLRRANGAAVAEQPDQDYLPDADTLSQQRAKLEQELAQLDKEIEGHASAVEEASGEPAAEFGLEMARGRRARILEALAEVESWEGRQEEMQAAVEEAERRKREAEEMERQRLEAEESERRRLEEEELERQRLAQQEADRLAREEEERQRLEAEAAQAASKGGRERIEAYDRLHPGLEPISSVLMKTKGVTSVMVVARDGVMVHKTQAEEETRLSEFVKSAMTALSSGASLGQWQFWVLEFAKGILVLQRVSEDYYLLVVGQAGANFGVLTWTIDKNKAQLEKVLAEAPPVPAD